MNSDDARRRRIIQDDATRQIDPAGDNPRASQAEDDLAAQRFQIASVVRQMHDAGYHPLTMIEMLLAGAAFLGDNYGVSRQQMQRVIGEVTLGADRSLIWTPR